MPFKIAVDAMGGDYAPRAAVEGAYAAAVEDGAAIVLVGQQEIVEAELQRLGYRGHVASDGSIEIVHAEEVVTMDDPATAPLRKKRRSSIRVACELVEQGRAAAVVTAGHTGAAMTAAMKVMGTIPGVDRPALAAVLPNPSGRTVLLDVGANVSTKPHHLRQFAVMGHLYAQQVLGTATPRVGLMSVGEEEGKGTEFTREVFKVLKDSGLNFVGNVEGRDVFAGTVDVIVCDGFVGNAVLKTAESLASMVGKMLEQELRRSLRTKVGAALAMPALREMRRRTDANQYGAAPLLGVHGGCFIGHGRSSAEGIRNSVKRAVEFCTHDVLDKIRAQMELIRQQEASMLGASELKGTVTGGEK
jgi:glycerol-3-phosphate acyltransferase PlsX